MIAVHGAPGSHKDFKYLTPHLVENGIRVIGINFPAMGYTSCKLYLIRRYNKCLDDPSLVDDNSERVQIVQGVIDALKLNEKLVFIGHSRGSENSLKTAALNPVNFSL